MQVPQRPLCEYKQQTLQKRTQTFQQAVLTLLTQEIENIQYTNALVSAAFI